jgi:hypothetical protein
MNQSVQLLQSLRYHLASYDNDGLFEVSLDHSPSEQLVDLQSWHTSVLVISCGMRHAALARAISQEANPLTGKLAKWSKSNKHYRGRFCAALFRALDDHEVAIMAISARGVTIATAESHLFDELCGKGHYSKINNDGKERVQFGPFMNLRTNESTCIDLPSNQAVMAIFTIHFVRRMHRMMHHALSTISPVHGGMVTWNFYADKPPNGSGGNYNRLLGTLLGMQDCRGSLRWGYFSQGDEVETDLLADNVAGLLRESLAHPTRYEIGTRPPDQRDAKGLFYWERWDQTA